MKNLRLLKNIVRTKINRALNLPNIPYKINLFVTNSCNLKCKTCKIWKIYQDNPSKKRDELELEDYQELFKKLNKDLFWLSISGGEPFLRKDISGIIKLALNECPNLSILSINTNGYLTDKIVEDIKEAIKQLKDTKLFINVSLDGLEKLHDEIKGVKGAYKKANITYKILKESTNNHKNIFIEREITISKYNIKEISKLLKNFEEPFILTFAYNARYYNNRESDISAKSEDLVTTLKGMKSPIYKKEDYIKKIFFNIAKRYFKKNILPCYSSWSSLTIDPYGNIFPCIMFDKKLGNIKESNFNLKSLIKNKSIKEAQRLIKSKKCPNCWTPCEAYTTILQNIKSLKYFLK